MAAKTTVRHGMLAEGSFGAFVLDQLCALGGVEARPMSARNTSARKKVKR